MLITQSPAAMSGFGGSFSVSRGQGSCGMSTEPAQERADCTMSGLSPHCISEHASTDVCVWVP